MKTPVTVISSTAEEPPFDRVATPRPQFSIRFLLLLTTAVAAALGLALAKGWNTLPLSLGLIWATMNAAGVLRFVQHTPRARSNWIWLAWLLFLLSLCLPAAKGCNNELIYGWEVATASAMAEAEGIYKVATWDEELQQEQNWGNLGRQIYVVTMINLCNLALILAPLAIVLFHYDRGYWMTNLVAVTAVLAWAFIVGDNHMPMSGYFVWCLSSAVMIAARPLPWSIWGLMMVHAGLVLMLSQRS